MKVEVWADVTCPWCGIGFHRLRTALSRFAHADQVEMVHRSYLLLPHAPEGTWPVQEHMAGRYALPGTDRVEVLGNILDLAWAHAAT